MHKTLCRWTTCLMLIWSATATLHAEGGLFPLDEVERGQRGYGLSVFEGTEPERFEFEVIGVWRNVQPDLSYILAEFSGQGLEDTGVIAGMSGSPVYIDGRLVGAVSFAWPFSKEPVGGITPIELMHDLLDAHRPSVPRSLGVEAFKLENLLLGDLDEGRLVESLARLRPDPVAGGQSGVQWIASGFGSESRRLLSEGLGNLSTSGVGVSDTASQELAPGSSVSGVLVDGDFRLAATGTVTDRVGDQILAFGHAFLGLGALELPMATSEVITVLSNQANSFKLANLGPIVGAFDLDHSAGFRGEMGRVAPMVPVTIDLNGPSPERLEVRVADLPQLTASLVAMSVLGSLEADPEITGSQSMNLVARFDLGTHGDLVIEQSFDGPSASLEMVIHLFAMTGFLQQNAFEEVEIESIDVDLSWQLEPRMATIVAAHASRTRVRPGESLDIRVDLTSYRGETFSQTLSIELPPDVPPGRFSVLIGDGVNIDGARLSVERAEPATLNQALELLNSLHSRRELLALGLFPGQGLTVSGAVMPRLPGSVRSLWAAAPTGGAQPLQIVVTDQGGTELDMPLAGIVRVDLEIEDSRPWKSGNGNKNGRGRSD